MARILLVDDDDLVGSLLEDVLGMQGYEVTRVPGTAEAWDAFRAGRTDAVVTDNRFKGGRTVEESGLGLARRVKAASPETIVVMVSSDPPPEASEVCDAILAKPIPMSLLRDALVRLGVAPGEPRPASPLR